jgi:cellulose synthase (UDP-forming)
VVVALIKPTVAERAPEVYLPQPPDDEEKYKYFGKPRRWVFAWLLLASAGVLYGYIHVAERAWLISPLMWLLLMVMVPPVVVNFWLRIGPPRLSLAEHQATVASYKEQGETVDVFLPSCGEPLAVLDNTLSHVSMMTWGGPKTVYVLDDSVRESVCDLADQYGFRYIVRPNPGEMKKAGNLTHALGVSTGDYIAVIDADFAVRSEFLYEIMPYFSDTKVGIVQTAQYYDVSNPSFSYIQRYAGTLQEIFFRFIQPARDRYNAAICAGTNLVYRRAAVIDAGGFAWVPIGEDVHSGVKLAWAGHETRYLPLCLAKGVAPTDFASLANQQARWCRSSMMLMIDKHFMEAPFTWKQRAAFWAAFLYYMSSAALLLTGPFPTLTMIWFYPGHIYPHNYLPILPAIAASLFAFPVLSHGWRPTIYRVCLINSCCHIYSVWYAIRGRVAEWVPTGASPDRGQVPVTVNRILCVWITVVQVLLWSGGAGARVRMAYILGDRDSGWSTALYAGATIDAKQGHLGSR